MSRLSWAISASLIFSLLLQPVGAAPQRSTDSGKSASAGSKSAGIPGATTAAASASAAASKNSQLRPIADKWALVIGISKFSNPNIKLKYAAKDAMDFYDYLINQAHFARDHVKLLTDEEATRERILDELGDKWLPHVAMPDDLVTIYVSTHGSPASADAGGINYLVAANTDPNRLYSTGIPIQDLTRLIKDRVHANRIVVIMDACHSGAAKTGGKSLMRDQSLDAAELSQGTGQLVICSSETNQSSWESERYPNGVFTKQLIESLRQKSSLGAAYDLMRDQVASEVLTDRGELQTPVLRSAWEGSQLILSSVPTKPRPGLKEYDPSLYRHERTQTSVSAEQNSVTTPSVAVAGTAPAPPAVSAGTTSPAVSNVGTASGMASQATLNSGAPPGVVAQQTTQTGLDVTSIYSAAGSNTARPTPAAPLSATVPHSDATRHDEKPAVVAYAPPSSMPPPANPVAFAPAASSPAQNVPASAGAVAFTPSNRTLFGGTAGLRVIPSTIWDSYFQQGSKSYYLGKYADAERLFNAAVHEAQKFNERDARIPMGLDGLAMVYVYTDRLPQAEETLKQAINLDENLPSSNQRQLGRHLEHLAWLYMLQSKWENAEPLLQRALGIWETQLGREQAKVADCLAALGRVYRAQGKLPESETMLTRALSIAKGALGEDDPAVAQVMCDLGQTLCNEERYSEAEPLLKTAVATWQRDPGSHPLLCVGLIRLGDVYTGLKKTSPAEINCRKGINLGEKLGVKHLPGLPESLTALSHVFEGQNKQPKVVEWQHFVMQLGRNPMTPPAFDLSIERNRQDLRIPPIPEDFAAWNVDANYGGGLRRTGKWVWDKPKQQFAVLWSSGDREILQLEKFDNNEVRLLGNGLRYIGIRRGNTIEGTIANIYLKQGQTVQSMVAPKAGFTVLRAGAADPVEQETQDKLATTKSSSGSSGHARTWMATW